MEKTCRCSDSPKAPKYHGKTGQERPVAEAEVNRTGGDQYVWFGTYQDRGDLLQQSHILYCDA